MFFCNFAYSNTIKDMNIICDSNEKFVLTSTGEIHTDTRKKTFEISIVNNHATLVHTSDSVTLFDYIDFKLTNVSNKQYFFENKNNDSKLFAKIEIDRIEGSALVTHSSDKTTSSLSEGIRLTNCKLKDNKPKF